MRAAWTFVLAVVMVVATCRVTHARRHGRAPHLDIAAASHVVATRHHVARTHRMPFAAERIAPHEARTGRIAEVVTSAEYRAPSAEQAAPVARGPPLG